MRVQTKGRYPARSLPEPGPGYRILGVDPGTRSVGFAVLELGRYLKPKVVEHGFSTVSRKDPVSERLRRIYIALEDLIKKARPEVIVVEEVFYGKNFKSALKIGEGRGVVFLAAAMAGREVVEYSPAAVKQAVSGYGRASKTQVQKVVGRLLRLRELPRSADAADALAIALCHAQRLCGGLWKPSQHPSGFPRKRRSSRKALRTLLDRLEDSRARG